MPGALFSESGFAGVQGPRPARQDQRAGEVGRQRHPPVKGISIPSDLDDDLAVRGMNQAAGGVRERSGLRADLHPAEAPGGGLDPEDGCEVMLQGTRTPGMAIRSRTGEPPGGIGRGFPGFDRGLETLSAQIRPELQALEQERNHPPNAARFPAQSFWWGDVGPTPASHALRLSITQRATAEPGVHRQYQRPEESTASAQLGAEHLDRALPTMAARILRRL